jgi:hypothetical protein
VCIDGVADFAVAEDSTIRELEAAGWTPDPPMLWSDVAFKSATVDLDASGRSIRVAGEWEASRHFVPPRLDNRVIKEDYAKDLGTAVLVLYGESGAGKSFAAIAIAKHLGCDVVLRFTPGDCADPNSALRKHAPSMEDDSAVRNTKVQEYVKARLAEVYGERPRCRAPSTKQEIEVPVVLVFDEFGEDPHIVRGIIASWEAIHAHVRKTLKLPTETPVHIIIAGTGVETDSLLPGSRADQFRLRHVKPAVFGHFYATPKNTTTESKEFASIPKGVYEFVMNGTSPTARLIRQLVTNARCATLFATVALKTLRVDEAVAPTEGLMRAAAMLTIIEYCRANALARLTHEELEHVVLLAMGAQLELGILPDTKVFKRLRVKYGLLTDHGKLDRVDGAIPAHAVMHLDGQTYIAPRNGVPRYHVAPVFPAMLQLLFGLDGRPSSGEGFEQAFADFLAVAVQMATVTNFSEAAVEALGIHCNRCWLCPSAYGTPKTCCTPGRSDPLPRSS